MEFMSVKEAAEQWNISIRRVQQYCKDGVLPGAVKLGKVWVVPTNTPVPGDGEIEQNEVKIAPDREEKEPFRMAMPLLNGAYQPGTVMEWIQSLPDKDDQAIAQSEYYFFSGQADEAAKILESYLDSRDPSLHYSANLLYAFANLSLGRAHLARFAMHNLELQVRRGLASESSLQLHAMGILTATAMSVLLHLPLPQLPTLEEYIQYLPGGMKLWGCYILAHKAYLERKYDRCLAIADMGIALCPRCYPVASVYVHIVAAIALINLKEQERAREKMEAAWRMAEKDGLIEPFGQHHGLLQGMIEVYFRKSRPKVFEQIITIAADFGAGWRKIHNPDAEYDVADDLTPLEFTVAMLYSRGWAAKEISAHMEMSDRVVRRHLSTIYEKLNISNRKELNRFMLL